MLRYELLCERVGRKEKHYLFATGACEVIFYNLCKLLVWWTEMSIANSGQNCLGNSFFFRSILMVCALNSLTSLGGS